MDTKEKVDALICTNKAFEALLMPEEFGYPQPKTFKMTSTSSYDAPGLVGINLVNMPIYSSLVPVTTTAITTVVSGDSVSESKVLTVSGYTDALFGATEGGITWADFDNCLAFVNGEVENPHKNKNKERLMGVMTLSPCSFWGKPTFKNTAPGKNEIEGP